MGIVDGQPSLSKFYGLQVKAESVRIKSMRASAQTACGGMKTHSLAQMDQEGKLGLQ